MKTITKKDVTRRTAHLLGEKISTTEMVVEGVFNTMREIMMNANPEVRIEIRDFGVFEVKKTHFKAGKILKKILKQPLKE